MLNLVNHIKNAAAKNRGAFANHTFTITDAVLADARKMVEIIQSLIQDPAFQQLALRNVPPQVLQDQNVQSVFCSADYHLTDQGIKLIEINTHASGGIASALWQEVLKESSQEQFVFPDTKAVLNSYWNSMEAEWQRWPGSKGRTLKKIAIVDDNPQSQPYLIEFEIAQAELQKRGYQVDIIDADGLHSLDYDFVYNRCLDFYFTQANHETLRTALLQNKVCISPSPRIHALIANKNTLVYLTELAQGQYPEIKLSAEDREFLKKMVPETHFLQSQNLEEVWRTKKRWFFKPRDSYQSKGVYRGKSISRPHFDKIETSQYILQEFIPVTTFKDGLKADLRFFHYGSEIQYGIARMYKGQVTNFRDPEGGVAPLVTMAGP